MPRSEFGRFLARSFTALEHEHRSAYLRTCRALAGRSVQIEIDSPAVLARFSASAVSVSDADAAGDLTLGTDKSTVFDLIDGKLTLLEAVRSERMQLRGSVESVADFHDALMIYLDGAVRSPSFPDLLTDYRR